MIEIEGTYYKGKVKLKKTIKTDKPVKVMVTFLDEEPLQNKKLTKDDFNFDKAREKLKNVSTDFSDEVIKQRRKEYWNYSLILTRI